MVGRMGVVWAMVAAQCLHADMTLPHGKDGNPVELLQRREAFLLLGGLAAQVGANAKLASTPPVQPGTYPRAKLWPIDRWLAGTYAPAAARLSDILVVPVVGALPLADAGLACLGHATWRPFFEDAMILTEALAWSSSLNLMVRASAWHPRPLTYAREAPLAERTRPEAAGSFYSGHSNAAFAGATLLATILPRRYPAVQPAWLWAGGGLWAAGVAGLRVAAGKHYLSDVVTGAGAGMLFGWLFAAWHLKPVAGTEGRLSLQPDPAGGAALRYCF